MEYKMKCNVCGKIFCYTDKDLKENASNAGMAALEAIGGLASTLGGGTIFHTQYLTDQSNRHTDKVIDYSQCPYCHSRNLSPYTGNDKKPLNASGNLPDKSQILINATAPTESLIKRAFLFLEDGDWDSAAAYCDSCLDKDPELAKAYLGKLMAELHVHSVEELGQHGAALSRSKYYGKILRFGSEELTAQLSQISEKAKEKIKQLAEIRKRLNDPDCSVMVALNNERLMANCADGSVHICGKPLQLFPQSQWRDLRQIGLGYKDAVGLRFDGSVIACGETRSIENSVSTWEDIKSISISSYSLLGLRNDGTVQACGDDRQCAVSDWKGILQIETDSEDTFGLCDDGTVKWCGNHPNLWSCIPDVRNAKRIKCKDGRLKIIKQDGKVEWVSNGIESGTSVWANVTDVSTSIDMITGLKRDGTVVAKITNLYGESDGSAELIDWNNIVALESGDLYTVGLKEDGTVVARCSCGIHDLGATNVTDWTNIVAIKADISITLGICADGTIVYCGETPDEGFDVSNIRLFNDISDLDKNIERNRERRRVAEQAAAAKRAEEQRKAEERRKARISELEAQREKIIKELENTKGLFAFTKKKKMQTQISNIDAELNNQKNNNSIFWEVIMHEILWNGLRRDCW